MALDIDRKMQMTNTLFGEEMSRLQERVSHELKEWMHTNNVSQRELSSLLGFSVSIANSAIRTPKQMSVLFMFRLAARYKEFEWIKTEFVLAFCKDNGILLGDRGVDYYRQEHAQLRKQILELQGMLTQIISSI
jgi:hypothetical protein